MAYDVVCVGSALLDVFVKSGKFKKIASGDYADGVALCEEYGGKTEVEEMAIVSGGAGTNAAVSFTRKGLKTALIAEIGQDLVGATIKQELVREDVDLLLMSEVAGEQTGMSVILVAPDGGRSALIHRGASKMLTKEDVRWDQLQSKWIYISSLGGEMALLEGLIGHAKAYGIKIAVNPGKAELEHLQEWGGMHLFEGVEVLLVNREEAGVLLQQNMEDEHVWKSEWCPPGPKMMVVTDGKNGGRVCVDGWCFWYESNQVQTVEETGAGDAFGTGLVAALMKGKDIKEAVEWGKKQAATVVQYMGTKQGLLTLEKMGI